MEAARQSEKALALYLNDFVIGHRSLLGWRRLVIVRSFETAVAVRHISQRYALPVHPAIRSADQVRRHGVKMLRPDGGGKPRPTRNAARYIWFLAV